MMQRRTGWTLGALVVVAVIAAGAVAVAGWPGGGAGGGGSPTMREYPRGERPAAPPIAGELLDGGRLDLAALRGDVVVVNIWASWCGPCRAETDDLEQVHQDTRELGVRFVGVNIRDDRDKAVQFLADRVSYPSIFDPGFEIGLGFRDPPAPIGPPATLVIDRSGAVAVAVYRQVGPVELAQAVTRVAGESPGTAEAAGAGGGEGPVGG